MLIIKPTIYPHLRPVKPEGKEVTILPVLGLWLEDGTFGRLLNGYRLHDDPAVSRDLKDDFIQELILILAAYRDQQKLVRMYARDENELKRWVLAICRNQLASTSSPFTRKYTAFLKRKVTLNVNSFAIRDENGSI